MSGRETAFDLWLFNLPQELPKRCLPGGQRPPQDIVCLARIQHAVSGPCSRGRVLLGGDGLYAYIHAALAEYLSGELEPAA